ncbi:MAG: adenine phosphoribosyltransferase [Candidatus Krumholzibacteria bacterium]|nr:adenine phosphoribosyltransferase [Candidatus Krumholzibacteria bacterium]
MKNKLKQWIRNVPDFPKPGILFRDITPILLDPEAHRLVSDLLYERYSGREFDKIAAIESRGFIIGSTLSYRLGKGLIPLRKPGKLPWTRITESYSLEYGTAALEMHVDAVEKGERILIIDDLLATGGTAAAAACLVERQGGIVEEIGFLVELKELAGRENLRSWPVYSFLEF